jgi:hypothetical protein
MSNIQVVYRFEDSLDTQIAIECKLAPNLPKTAPWHRSSRSCLGRPSPICIQGRGCDPVGRTGLMTLRFRFHPFRSLACQGGEEFKSALIPVLRPAIGRIPVLPQKLERIVSHARVWKIDPGASPEVFLSGNCPKMLSVSARDSKIV